jgi:D-threonate/D-erythronate kinase
VHHRADALLVTADDTTGALETAGACADNGWNTLVMTTVSHVDDGAGSVTDGDCLVFDLATRHLPPGQAYARISQLAQQLSIDAHKIDSTLRGNWSAEIAAFVHAGRRVLLIAAHPEAGRTCLGGVVRAHGVPVHQGEHGADRRSAARTSRPAEVIDGAVELRSDAVSEWLSAGPAAPPVAVADATTVEELSRLVAQAHETNTAANASRPGLLLCGPSAVTAALAGIRSPGAAQELPPLHRPALVVLGSLHHASRAQLDSLRDSGDPVLVLTTDPGADLDPQRSAEQLGGAARAVAAREGIRTVVVVGGDTAAAFIGGRSVRVHGSWELGVAQGTIELDGRHLALVAKPGAFGDSGTLVRLMQQVRTP